MHSVGVIVGSAFEENIADLALTPLKVATPRGDAALFSVGGVERPAYVSFRHGRPHGLLPNQIDYVKQAMAFKAVDCRALLVTSSVGVLDPDVELDRPLLVSDLLMLDNRLPDGSACTIFGEPKKGHGHLVVKHGLFSSSLNEQLSAMAQPLGFERLQQVVFAYVGGPRTKTQAENRALAAMGAQVNSMTLGPEVVLANELEIPSAGLVVGHKYSLPRDAGNVEKKAVSDSLVRSNRALEGVVASFLRGAEPTQFGNYLYRF